MGLVRPVVGAKARQSARCSSRRRRGPGRSRRSASALVGGVRRNRWTGSDADTAYELLMRLPVQAVSDRRHLERAWELSRRYDNHPVYDMLYAATAEAFDTVFITADETLLQRLGHLGWVRRPGT